MRPAWDFTNSARFEDAPRMKWWTWTNIGALATMLIHVSSASVASAAFVAGCRQYYYRLVYLAGLVAAFQICCALPLPPSVAWCLCCWVAAEFAFYLAFYTVFVPRMAAFRPEEAKEHMKEVRMLGPASFFAPPF